MIDPTLLNQKAGLTQTARVGAHNIPLHIPESVFSVAARRDMPGRSRM